MQDAYDSGREIRETPSPRCPKRLPEIWSDHRLWATFTNVFSPLVLAALVIQLLRHGFSGMLSGTEALLSGLVGVCTAMIGHYVIAMRHGAEDLDKGHRETQADLTQKLQQREQETSFLSERIEELRKPKRSATNERYFQEAREILCKCEQDQLTVLRHLHRHKIMTVTSLSAPNPPAGMTRDRMFEILVKLDTAHIVKRVDKHERAMAITEWEIMPTLIPAFDELLYQDNNS